MACTGCGMAAALMPPVAVHGLSRRPNIVKALAPDMEADTVGSHWIGCLCATHSEVFSYFQNHTKNPCRCSPEP